MLILFIATLLFHTGSVNAQTDTYPTSGSQYISVSRASVPGIHLTAPQSVIKAKFSGNTSYARIWVGDGAFHTGIDSVAPVTPRARDTEIQVCGSNSSGAKDSGSCTAVFDTSNFSPLQEIPIQEVGGTSFAHTINMPVATDGYRHVYIIVNFNTVGLNAFKIGATGYSNRLMRGQDETNYSRVGFAATQSGGYNMSLVHAPLNGSVRETYTLQFKAPCTTTTGFDLRWYDADRPPTGIPNDTSIRWVLRNDTTGQTLSSVQMAFFSRISENAFLGGEEQSAGTRINNSSLMRVQAGDRYTWSWYDVLGNNGVQMQLPFDEPDYDSACPPPDNPPSGNVAVSCTGLTISGAEDPDRPNQSVQYDVYYDGGNGIGTGFADANTNAGTFDFISRNVPLGSRIAVGFYNYTSTGSIDNSKARWVSGIVYSPDPSCPNFIINEDPSVSIISGDTELPIVVRLGNTFRARNIYSPTSYIGVNGVDVTCRYKIIRANTGVEVNIGTNFSGTVNIPGTATGYACSGDINVAGNNLVAGDRVCVQGSVNPRTGRVAANGTITSAKNASTLVTFNNECIRVVNRPFVSFYGGDVSAGAAYGPVAGPFTCNTARGIATFNRSSGGYLGSGVEFAAQAAGNISGFSSSRGVGANPKRLSFTNTDGNATFGGGFGCARSIPNYFSATAGQSFQNRPVLNLASITASGNYFFTNPAGVRVWGTLPQGVRANIYIRGNVFVEDNITYATGPGGNWGAITDIPALRLYTEGDIHINRTVTTMYGFYFAQPVNAATGGQIYTCSSAPGAQVSVANMFADCNTKLTVRGGFTAKKVNLLRSRLSLRNGTAATESTSTGSSAAEVFVYAPEAFLVGPESITTNGGSDDPGIQYISSLQPVL